MEGFMKNRPVRVLLFFALLAVGGGCYYLLAHFLSISIPCFFYQITGWQCPGCGISRMFFHLMEGDVSSAFTANPVLFCLLPVFAGYAFFMTKRYLRGQPLASPAMEKSLLLPLAVLLIWGVARNL